mgnify:CR=1 FL=1
MLLNETREIDGQNWTVQAFPASIGLELGATLVQHGLSFAGDLDDVPAAVRNLFANLPPKGLVAFAKRLLEQTICEGEGGAVKKFDTLFVRRYSTLIKVVAFVVEFNFAGPFDDWKTLVGGMVARFQGTSPAAEEPPTSTQ